MYRSSMILIPFVLLVTACASPREVCLRDASAEPRRIAAQIADTELALARGYRLVTLRDRRIGLASCIGRRADGAAYRYGCYRPVTDTRQEPVGIDYSEERARLARLRDSFESAADRSERLAELCPVPI